MGGEAEKWSPGRGRRPGWGTHAGGVDPGGSWRPGPGWQRGPGRRPAGNSRSTQRTAWRLWAGAPAERPGRVQKQPPPLQLLSQPPPQAWAPPASDPPPAAAPPPRGRGAASASRARVTLMLRGAPELGGASLATPPPSHRGSWPGRHPPRRPGFMWWPRHHRCPACHKSRERPAGRSLPTPRASLPGEPPAAARVPTCWAARALRATRGALGRTRRFGVQRLSGRLHRERLERCFFRAVLLFPTCLPPTQLAGLSSAESCCSGFLKLFKLFLQLGIYIFNTDV